MHPDPRSGCDERSSQCSNELLSVPDVRIRHPMQHARKVRWRTPVTEAPHLSRRSLRGDPLTLRARRPLIMMMRAMPGGALDVGSLGSSAGRLEHGSVGDLAALEVAPQCNGKTARQRHDAHTARALALREASVVPLAQGAVGLQAQPTPRKFHQQGARSPVAGLADALLGLAVAAGVGRGRQPQVLALGLFHRLGFAVNRWSWRVSSRIASPGGRMWDGGAIRAERSEQCELVFSRRGGVSFAQVQAQRRGEGPSRQEDGGKSRGSVIQGGGLADAFEQVVGH